MQSLDSWLSQGPYTLALSSSFFGFYSHCAIVTSLFEKGYRPQKITGTSAGALVGAALASGLEPKELRELLFSMEQKDFWDPQWGPGYLKGEKFVSLLRQHLAPTFTQTKIPLEVAALDIFSMRTHFLKTGDLPQAVFASCAVPVMFHPVRVGRRWYYDGGVFNKSGVNPEDQNQRILNVYLESDGLSGIYENKTLNFVGPDHRVLRFRKIPRVSFHSMQKGPEAYKEILGRAQQSFSQLFQRNMLDA